MTLNDELEQGLEVRKTHAQYRSRRITESAQGAVIIIDGKQLINFCSNDYLGLANHPEVVKAFKKAADVYGVGSGASQLVTGHQHPHHALEEELADFFGRERVLLFSTGYMANLGVVSALTERHDEVFEDKLNHASLIDAAMLSRAKLTRYTHKNTDGLENQLEHSKEETKFIIRDGVFSMDGDIAKLNEIVALAEKYDAMIMVDDSHATGFVGTTGRGSAEYHNVLDKIDIFTSTLGKALGGGSGGFTAASQDIIDLLRQRSRPYLFSNSLTPALVAASIKAFELVNESNQLRRPASRHESVS